MTPDTDPWHDPPRFRFDGVGQLEAAIQEDSG